MPAPLHVVLHRPEIPNNTGNIGRTCVATGATLHLIHPLGFDTDDKARKRAGLDYWPRLILREHADWESYLADEHSPRLWAFSARAKRSFFDVEFRRGDHLVFGSETRGLPGAILASQPTVCLPMVPNERSINLASVVCAAMFEALRQMLTRKELAVDADGRFSTPTDGPPNTPHPSILWSPGSPSE